MNKEVISSREGKQGIEGFFSEESEHIDLNPAGWMATQGQDFLETNSPPSIDFLTLHVWREAWNINKSQAVDYVQDRIRVASEEMPMKPLMLDEFNWWLPSNVTSAQPEEFPER